MKIIFFGSNLDFLSGHSHAAYELARGFMEKGHQVTVITNQLSESFQIKKGADSDLSRIKGLKIIQPYSSLLDFIYKKRKLKILIEREIKEADVIHGFDFTSFYFLSTLFGEFSCPTVCTLNSVPKLKINHLTESGVSSFIRFFSTTHFLRSYLTPGFFLKSVFNSPDGVITSSKFLANLITREYQVDPNKIKTIYPSIDIGKFEVDTKPKKSKTFLYFGWGSVMRGMLDLVLAFEGVFKGDKDSKLILAPPSRDLERGYLVRLIKIKYGHLPIIIKDHVSDIKDLIDLGDFLVFPFRTSYGYAQPPIVLLEGMAAGKPVISTSTGSVPEILKNKKTGLLVKSADIRHLAKVMDLIKNDDTLAQQLGENARAFVKQSLNLDKMRQETLSYYQTLIVKKKRQRGIDKYAAKKGYSTKKCVETYDRERFTSFGGQLFDKIEKEILRGVVPKDKKSKILEVGTGTGRFSIFLAQKGYRVLATDISKEMLEKAKMKAKKFRASEKVKFQIADIYKLPYQKNYFDFVYCIRVVNQLFDNDDKKEAIKELLRVTKPGRILLFDVINKASLGLFKKPEGLITIGRVKKIVDRNGGEVIEIKGRMILSQTILEKTPPVIAQFVSKLDNVICQLIPNFATRVYFIVRKKA